VRFKKQRLRDILSLLIRSTAAFAVIAANCILMVWTGGKLYALVGEPLVAILPILGFGTLTFFAVHYLFASKPKPKSHPEPASLP
jgi:hypothetical protein